MGVRVTISCQYCIAFEVTDAPGFELLLNSPCHEKVMYIDHCHCRFNFFSAVYRSILICIVL